MSAPAGIVGVDASSLQASVDWAKVAAAGNRFAFLRGAEGITPDARYEQHLDGARSAGLLVGAYIYWRPRHTPAQLVDAFLRVAGNDPWSLPPVIDLESLDAADQLSPAALEDHVTLGANLIGSATGIAPILYVAPGFADAKLRPTHGLGVFSLWLAAYLPKPLLPRGWDRYLFWQFTGHGRVPGDPGDADCNVFAGTAAELAHLAGVPTEAP